MTRSEAITYAISTGKPITHKYFSDNEYVKYVNYELIDENGYYLDHAEFWQIRQGGEWEDGWTEYKG